jgi:NADH-quinone oxidoreductase subunit C
MSAISPVETLKTELGAVVLNVEQFRGEWTVSVKTDAIRDVLAWCKRAGFEMLNDMFGVDHFGDEERFEVVYMLLSLTQGYLRIKVRVPEANAVVPSVVSVYVGANWHEREAFDMYGIRFEGHPDLKRILMWEGYPFFPLRKDFPVSGLNADLPVEADASAGAAEQAPMAGGPFYGGIATSASMVSKDGRPSTIGREPRQYDTGAEQLVKLRNPVRKEAV